MKAKLSTLTVILCIAGTALAQTDGSTDDDAALVHDLTQQWESAWNSGDGAAVAALYTEDGVHMVATSTFMGHAAIADLANTATKAGAGGLAIAVEHVHSFPRGMWCDGTYTIQFSGQLTQGEWSGFAIRYGTSLRIARSMSVARPLLAREASPL